MADLIVLAGRGDEDEVNDDLYQLKTDPDTKTLHIQNWVWNTNSLEWERMTQPNMTIDGRVTANFEALESIVGKLVKEVEKLNIQVSLMTETEITNEDLE